MFHQRRQHRICFAKTFERLKKSCRVFQVFKASAVISKERKKVKASEKKVKKYKDLYEEKKRQHKEALQRYQENHMDEMEIISLHKWSNKKTPQPKKAPKSFKSDEPKKAPISPEFIDDPSEEEQEPKKTSRPSDGKNTATKAGKKI